MSVENRPTAACRSNNVDPKLLEILVCPLTKAPLRYDAAAGELISDKAGLAYPIRDGIPIMLVDEARQLETGQTHKTAPYHARVCENACKNGES